MNRIALPIACHGFVLAFALSFAAPAVAQDEAMPLAEHRWSEQAYGLSLQPPAEARPVERPNSGGLVRFIVGETLNIRVDIENTLDQHEPETQNDRPEPESPFIRRNDSEVKLENVKSWALRQVAFANPNARLLEDELTEVVGRPAARIVFKVLPKDRPAWILAQVFMKIDPYTVVRFELQADADDQARALATFDAMLETIEVEDPRKLNERRAQWIEAGQAWFTSLDRSRLQEHLVPSQWLRIVEDGEDVGHIHIRQAQAEMLGHPGIRIEIAQRLVTDTGILDTVSELFASTSGTTELWSIRSARRDKDELESELPDREQVRSVEAWVNTGVRSRQELTVSREGPNELDRDQWRQLPEAYLSQVDLHLLPALLPRDREVTMAFYTYYPKTSQLGLRRIRVEPIDDGGYRVIQRPAPDQGEQVSRYDADGRLVQRHMADGRVILPSSEDRVRRIWADR